MKLPESKSKEIFQRYGISVPDGNLVTTPQEAATVAENLLKSGAGSIVLKAQILAGGRGKGKIIKNGEETGSGIRIVRSSQEAFSQANLMLGGNLITAQNKKGSRVNSLLVEKGISFTKQIYISFTIDRGSRSITCICSGEGGMEIEELASTKPEAIIKIPVDIHSGWMPFHSRRLSSRLVLDKNLQKLFTDTVSRLFNLFIEQDCLLAEVNPLVVTDENNIVALDAKIIIDDNALIRHGEFSSIMELAHSPEEETELEAKKAGLSYIKLNGNIGCLVNGAGLAMATMDIIKYCGGEPANFLDVGGTASEEAVKKAFTIILQDPSVKAIFVNIFGGIMRCDVIAKGIVGATMQLGLSVPLVVRLEGNMVEEGRKILMESGLKIITASNMGEGALKAVEATRTSSPNS